MSRPRLDGCCGYLGYSMLGWTIQLDISSGQGSSESPQGTGSHLSRGNFHPDSTVPHLSGPEVVVLPLAYSCGLLLSGRRRGSFLGFRSHISERTETSLEISVLLWRHSSSEVKCADVLALAGRQNSSIMEECDWPEKRT